MIKNIVQKVFRIFERKKYTFKIQYIYSYAREEMGDEITTTSYVIKNIIPHRQDLVGGEDDKDCTLVSISTLLEYLSGVNFHEIYNIVIARGVKPFLISNPKVYGTIPFFIKRIMTNMLKYYRLCELLEHKHKVKQRYLKGIGYNADKIIKNINEDNPVILNLSGSTKKDYYSNHTVLIVGYYIFRNQKGLKKIIFKIFDNWNSKSSTYLDYDAIPKLSTINYLQRGDN